QPISEFEAPKAVNPETDLVPLCANCHAVVHRRRDRTLSVDELKGLVRGRWVCAEADVVV
ncbi:TPA: restriction endonuclease, partial [Pseudomonas aeruginosa]|nr:restriction endonuclease [Pseudomonas aeruginosa]